MVNWRQGIRRVNRDFGLGRVINWRLVLGRVNNWRLGLGRVMNGD